jgi:hypothetical protein
MILRAASMAFTLVLVGAAGALAQHERGDAEVALTFGVLACLDGEHGRAADLLAEVVRLEPENAVARHWLGRAYRALGRESEAERELATASRLDPQLVVPPGEEGPSLFGPEAQPPGAAPRISGWASFAVGTDSNPALLNEPFVVVLPGRDPLAGDVSDVMGRIDLQLDLRPASGGSAWSPEIVLRAGQARYRDLEFLNAGRFEGRFQLARGRTPDGLLRGALGAARVPAGHSAVAFLVQVAASRERMDGEPWADTRAAGAILSLRTGRAGRFEVDALLRNVDLANDPEEPFTIAGRVTTLGLRQQFYLGRADRWLRVGATAGARDAGLAYDASIRQIAADLALALTDRWSLWIGLAAGREAFRDDLSNPFATGPREDDLRAATAVLARRLGQRIFLTGRITRLQRRAEVAIGASDPVDLGYRRALATAGITWAF